MKLEKYHKIIAATPQDIKDKIKKDMDDMDIIEGNKLIAGFMQLETKNRNWDERLVYLYGNYWYPSEKLKYHSSWDWLMPVVEKIQSLGGRFIIGDGNRVTVYNKDYDWRNGSTEDELIECVWHGAIQFIKWHNQNKHSND